MIFRYLMAYLFFSFFSSSLHGQISFSQEIGYNNYNFIERDPGGFSLNLEDTLAGLYFGLNVEKKLDKNISVGVIAHYSTVKHNVDLNAPGSNPIIVYQYGIIDIVPMIKYTFYKGVRVGLGPLVQNQINKKYIILFGEEINKVGKRNLGFLFLLEANYKKTGISLMYKRLLSLPEDSIFTYTKFSGIRVGISYKLAEVFNKK